MCEKILPMMIPRACLLALALTIWLNSPSQAADALEFPKAEKKPVVDSWFGVDLQDNYPWLQNAADPAVKAFATAQNQRTRKYLDSLPKPAAAPVTSTDLAKYPVERTFVKASDGSQISLLIHRPLQLDGTGSAILEIGNTPSSAAGHLLALGVTICVADLSNRPRSDADLAVIAQFLIKKKVTQPDRLAILGNPTNGALVSLVIVQFPSLFRAAVLRADLFDLLHDSFTNLPTRSQFNDRLARSPYRRIVDGTPYPAILLLTSPNEPSPGFAQSLKLVACLQEATTSPHPILFRISSDKVDSEDEDIVRFLLKELGVLTQPTATPLK